MKLIPIWNGIYNENVLIVPHVPELSVKLPHYTFIILDYLSIHSPINYKKLSIANFQYVCNLLLGFAAYDLSKGFVPLNYAQYHFVVSLLHENYISMA